MRKIIKCSLILVGLTSIIWSFSSCANNSEKSISNETSSQGEKYYKREEDKIFFGNYPQALVEDEEMVSKLNNKIGEFDAKKWTDYKVSDAITDHMYYLDIDYDEDGAFDYRGVYLKKYIGNYVNNGWIKTYRQQDNGFELSKVYYFKYEPIEWNILKEENGKAFIHSILVLDSQDYYYPQPTNEDYQNPNFDKFNYELSYVRKWLNDTFYNTAFNDLERIIIQETKIDNTDENYPNNNFNDTSDNIFLLSNKEAEEFYPWNNNTDERKSRCSAGIYAFSQGMRGFLGWTASGKIGENWCHYWHLRTVGGHHDYALRPYYVNERGATTDFDSYSDFVGIRPACWIEL